MASNLAPSAVGRSCKSSLPIATSTKALRSSAVSPIDPAASCRRGGRVRSARRAPRGTSGRRRCRRRSAGGRLRSRRSPRTRRRRGRRRGRRRRRRVAAVASSAGRRRLRHASGGDGAGGRRRGGGRAWKFVHTRPRCRRVSQTAPPTAETAFATVSSPTPVGQAECARNPGSKARCSCSRLRTSAPGGLVLEP